MERIAVVTGAAKGIGEGITQKLCEAEYQVIMISRGKDIYEKAETFLAMGYQVAPYRCDIIN